MNIKDLLYRPIKLLPREKGFDKVGEAVIIDVNRLIDGERLDIEYIVINKNNTFLVGVETIKDQDAEDSIEVLNNFSSKWKKAMIEMAFRRDKVKSKYYDYGDMTLKELLYPANIEEYNLHKYF